MKQFILLFIGLLLAGTAFADATIINNSKTDVDVSYQFCHWDQTSHKFCDEAKTVTIKADLDHHYTINNTPSDARIISILSAIEKDQKGKIIAQGNYSYKPNESMCGTPISITDSDEDTTVKINAGIVLDDEHQSPIIMCFSGTY